ncbi:DUF1638 domain-containing protein [Methanolobus sp. ZRKC3]|uniref:DUF1638 domain-containing protein n=1 Tax=Methanolobus sp. ZRKC3 TaxID=3125786 RepID=UPI00324F65D9
MPAISFIACKIFEDEIIHVIENDPSIERLILVENDDSGRMVEKLDCVGIPYELLPLKSIPNNLDPGEPGKITLIVSILELALHAYPDNLRDAVYGVTEEMSAYSDGVLLFYGLCGNVLAKAEADLQHLSCPVHILKEDNGEIIDDCIGAVLGGRDVYLEKLKSCSGVGTFFMTPMWAANWREMIYSAGMTSDPNNIEMSKFVFEQVGYKTVAKINTGLHYEKDFDSMVEEFARLFDFDVIEMEASPALLQKCYMELREKVLA